ncbi:MAG: T9SS type A sorting domain-containing protein [Flavobacteriaceae bacterium]|nr:T9SS type A sorting domain-containing protein [Flavobacteriaceae bacterium]
MKKYFYFILFSILLLTNFNQAKAQCNWASKKYYVSFWDTCSAANQKYSLNGAISFKGASCFKYQWIVDSVNVGTAYNMHQTISKNGTYNVCVKVTDTCNNCDTTFCSTRTITCFSSANTCNWASRNPYKVFWDSCTATSQTINGYINFNSSKSCFKYQWTVNGTKVGKGDYAIYYPITQNGTYNLCVKVMDTCNNCDTSFCSSRTITCFSSSAACNWASRYPYKTFWDSCTKTSKTINGYINFNSSKSCFKYQWSVNGKNVGNGDYAIYYPIYNNGTYELCVKVTDTCNLCDTSFCSTRTVTCFSNNTNCNWASRFGKVNYFDSCANNLASINSYISFNYSKTSCFKYEWTINGNKVSSTTGYPYYIKYKITQNGTYALCVKVIDTCNNCDTSYCSSRSITCLSSSDTCNWASRYGKVYYFDSCANNLASISGYISFNYSKTSCFKYEWTVNGNKVSSYTGAPHYMKYKISQNGQYTLCVKVIDTCNNCDTSFCSTRSITCLGNNSGCNWASKKPNIKFWDSCTATSKSINGYVSFNTNGCFKYQWKVNGNLVGNGYLALFYPVTQNGTYKICVKVTDTCNNCDTLICDTRVVNCFTGIGQSSVSKLQLYIYPNPSLGNIQLDWHGTQSAYTIVNIAGQPVQAGRVISGNQSLDLTSLPSGIYFIQLIASEGVLVEKIILQRE